MRIVYFTYWGKIGDRVLDWMVKNTNEEIIAVVSRPGDQGESIKDIAFRYYLPLYQPQENVNDSRFIEVLRKLKPDLFISMYFGRLFSPELLDVPGLGCINMHPSLLPKGRGQGPSTWPIVYGDKETGQTIHYLDEGIDSGDIIAQRVMPIEPDDTSATLGAKLEDLGFKLFTETWPLSLRSILIPAPGACPYQLDQNRSGDQQLVPRVYSGPGRMGTFGRKTSLHLGGGTIHRGSDIGHKKTGIYPRCHRKWYCGPGRRRIAPDDQDTGGQRRPRPDDISGKYEGNSSHHSGIAQSMGITHRLQS